MAPQIYNDPKGGSPSTIGTQLATYYYQKKALVELQKEKYFSQLASTTNMPKHMGKTIKRFHYLPLLDDRNVNDQGIDAAGATIADGNLYGSSKDIGTIQGKLPTLSEAGGRVNRVGFKRVELEGSIAKFGFFDEYTQESLDFDSDAELEMHINREMLFGAHEITEDMLQIDLLNSAAVIRYPGAATGLDGLSGETGAVTEVTYEDLSRLAIDLDNNRCPKHTKIITGSRMIDTRVVNAARIMYVGSELQPTIEKMKDFHNNPAFIPLAHYAAAGSEINGEIGTVGYFRVVVVPEMLHHNGSVANSVGAAETSNAGYRTTDGRYDAYPMLVVGSESFTTIGFQTSGKTVKFKIYHKKPGEAMATTQDPYGETGFMSIKWYYGFMALRTERLAVIWTVAPL